MRLRKAGNRVLISSIDTKRERWVKLFRRIVYMFAILCIIVSSSGTKSVEAAPTTMDIYIEELLNKAKIPGLAVIVVQSGKVTYQKTFGYADLAEKRPVTEKTLFELGSNTKAFTGLAVLQLVASGEINLDDPVSKFLPWFNAWYEGEQVPITVRQLLFHTSGIPFESIGDIPADRSPDALEKTIRRLSGVELKNQPGEEFLYATINYDVLGLIIEKVTGQSYERYMTENLLHPLGLKQTFVGIDAAKASGLPMASGYKIAFGFPQQYEPPTYGGNVPAGYILSNLEDLTTWLMYQTGAKRGEFDHLFAISHEPDRSVAPSVDGSSYAAGWSVFQDGAGEWSHSGNNPTFSSYIAFRPHEKIGVAVLANMNSEYTALIGSGLMRLLLQKELPEERVDSMYKLDQFGVVLLISLLLTSGSLLWSNATIIRDIVKGERKRAKTGIKGIAVLFSSIAAILMLLSSIHYIPYVFFYKLNWNFLEVWAPLTLRWACYGLLITGVLFVSNFLLSHFYQKRDNYSLFQVAAVGLINGFCNAFIIYTINRSFIEKNNFENGLFFYFLLGVVVLTLGQWFLRSRLVRMTNGFLYSIRMELIEKLLRVSYQKIESEERGNIYSVLHNDTETLSRSIHAMATSITSSVTLLFFFMYLGIIHIFGLLISLAVVLIAASLYALAGNAANRFWNKTRDIQNTFFKMLENLVHGFKELCLHRAKQMAFFQHISEKCADFCNTRMLGDLKLSRVFVLGDLLFIAAIGFVTFAFPLLFDEISRDTRNVYVLTFLFMTGPVNGILGALPQLIQMNIARSRIHRLKQYISENQEMHRKDPVMIPEHSTNLTLRQITFKYKNMDNHSFSVGPLDADFSSSQITFITGGNGSGKSTLVKLMTGLYAPDDGRIEINGRPIQRQHLGEYFSAIFSDYYLFERLYGIDVTGKEEEINYYLSVFGLKDKLYVRNGEFSTTDLSTGQKKRLALLLSFLEDRPICLFDEWAAEQDPDYRKIFYKVLLPELKRKGKCVIVVTHDDRYFDIADQVIKMDFGQIVQRTTKQLSNV